MKKLLLPLIFLCFFGFVGFSQTCGVATDNLPGCLMCNNVYIGNTDGYTQDINPWLPCDWENSQWLRFVAGTNPLTVSLTCFNFTNPPGPPPAGGLELALLDQNLNIVSTACGSTNMVSFTLTTAIIGETYTICIAGHNGSNFDFVLTVDDIIGGFDPQPQSIQADPDLPEYCPGQLVNYNINPVNGATGYTWVVNGSGTIVNGQNSTGIVVRMTGPGGGVVCVTPTSDCGPGTPWCKSFNVAAIPINTLPPMEFCSSDFPVRINGETFPSAGVFTKNYTGSNGCDSTVIYTIMQIIIPTTVEPAQTFCQ
ncbi:MAG: hypothetical protein R2879_21375, partial [Saprospiraceae bacterium]